MAWSSALWGWPSLAQTALQSPSEVSFPDEQAHHLHDHTLHER